VRALRYTPIQVSGKFATRAGRAVGWSDAVERTETSGTIPRAGEKKVLLDGVKKP
jgi:hypothetical protein